MLTVQFGQCGNQLGYDLFSKIRDDLESSNTGVPYAANYEYTESTIEKWFDGITKHGQHLARTILVDSEEKVINKVYNDATASWIYKSSNIVCQSSGGSANNWAYGYMTNGQRLSDRVLNVARQETEKLDHLQGFLLLLSSAGGTGSGIGSRIVEFLREEYETKPIVATIVLPFIFGEVCTQNYNTILTLARFSDEADFSILFENEQMYAMCTNLLRNPNTMLQDMNGIISENLLSVFQPVNGKCNMNFLVSRLVAHPSFRFVNIRSTPHAPKDSLQYEPVHKWDVYVRYLKETLRVSKSQMELTNAQLKTPNSVSGKTINDSHAYSPCVSNVLVTRGKYAEGDDTISSDLQKRYLYPEWITLNPFTHLHQQRKFVSKNKFLTLIANNSEIYRLLDAYLDKAWNSYKRAAFLHKYKQFGLEEDDFLRAFAKVENTVQEYKSLKNNYKKD